MAIESRVKETTTTTGTGAYTLAGAVPGYRSFFAAFGNGVPIYYAVEAGAEWERGYGTLTGGTTLNRTEILGSSNGGAPVNWGAGTKDVWCDFPEELAVALHSTSFGALVQTALRTFTRRIITAVTPLAVADGDFIGGNPAVSIASLAALKTYMGAGALGYSIFQAADLAALRAVVDLVPVGTVLDFAGGSLPSGFLWCAGQNVSRTTYSALFTAIGTTHGAGDGSTTFGVPDLRGRVGVGRDDMGGSAANRVTNAGSGITGTTLGASGGAQNFTPSISKMALHGHPFVMGETNLGSPNGAPARATTGITSHGPHTGAASTTAGQQIGGEGGGAAQETMPPALILNKIIYAGV